MSWEAWGDGDDGQDYDHLIEAGWLGPDEAEALRAENERLRKALATVPVIAGLVHKLWDSDQDSKVGKWLIALAGGCPGYTALTDELHAAIATAPQAEPSSSAREAP